MGVRVAAPRSPNSNSSFPPPLPYRLYRVPYVFFRPRAMTDLNLSIPPFFSSTISAPSSASAPAILSADLNSSTTTANLNLLSSLPPSSYSHPSATMAHNLSHSSSSDSNSTMVPANSTSLNHPATAAAAIDSKQSNENEPSTSTDNDNGRVAIAESPLNSYASLCLNAPSLPLIDANNFLGLTVGDTSPAIMSRAMMGTPSGNNTGTGLHSGPMSLEETQANMGMFSPGMANQMGKARNQQEEVREVSTAFYRVSLMFICLTFSCCC